LFNFCVRRIRQKCSSRTNEKIKKWNSTISASQMTLNLTMMLREKKTSLKKKVFQKFHESICWVSYFKSLWIDKKNAIKIWTNSKNTNRKRIIETRKRTSSWNVVQSRNRILLRFYRKRLSSFENYVAHENSHDVSRSLTSFQISNSQSVDWDRDKNDKKSNQKQRAWILLWALSKFLIFHQKKEKRKVSSDQCRFEDESNHHSKCELVLCDWRIFWRICWLCHRFARESIFWIRSIVVNRKMSRHDDLHDLVWFNENDNDFHENNQFRDSIRSNDQ
jgi:hypothetical protein